MALQFTVHSLEAGATIPPAERVSSVAIVAFDKEGKIVVTGHKLRGWDIPGGHVEPGEEVIQALVREVREEVGGRFTTAKIIARITSNETEGKYADKEMLIFATSDLVMDEVWEPAEDVAERAVLDSEEVLNGYRGDRENMRSLIEMARRRITVENNEVGREHRILR